jgi:hypothetical protein
MKPALKRKIAGLNKRVKAMRKRNWSKKSRAQLEREKRIAYKKIIEYAGITIDLPKKIRTAPAAKEKQRLKNQMLRAIRKADLYREKALALEAELRERK